MKKKNNNILINASNLHSGGAVQVAVSFINELSLLGKDDIDIVVSTEIHNQLVSIGTVIETFNFYRVYDVFGLRSLINLKYNLFILSYTTVFTIFGPLYLLKKPKFSVVGFAQPWIIYPKNEIYYQMGFFHQRMNTLKYKLQKFFYLKSDKIIVELDHVKKAFKKITNFENIFVVENCISSIYLNKKSWKTVNFTKKKDVITLGIISRDYPHKNLDILSKVSVLLRKEFKVNVEFVVTLAEKEWKKKSKSFQKNIKNLGPLDILQCPSFYKLLDGVIFPSLLECFSATPIEAMIMKKPVFASNRIFITEVCSNFVNYFEPTNPYSIAQTIYDYFKDNNTSKKEFMEIAYQHALKYSNPEVRTKKYIKLIK